MLFPEEFDVCFMHIYQWIIFTCHFWEPFSQCSFHMTESHLVNGYYFGPCGTVSLDRSLGTGGMSIVFHWCV